MQFIGNVLDYFLARNNKHVALLVSTSGDTGPAAIHAVKGKKALDCFVLFPTGLISETQAKQMTTVNDSNIHVYGVAGTSDDNDQVVKQINNDLTFKKEHNLCSINSVNWVRVLVQIVHFFHAYFVVSEFQQKVIFSIPTGALGDGIAAYIACIMGLPVEKLIYATNENDVIAKFVSTGVFSHGKNIPTNSPAIDIQMPYNVERLLYYISNQDSHKVAEWMLTYEKYGNVRIPIDYMQVLKKHVTATSSSQHDTLEVIGRCYKAHRYIIDPHTAVGVRAAELILQCPAFGLRESKMAVCPVICLATAHYSKFLPTIKQAIGIEPELPLKIKALDDKKDNATYITNSNNLLSILRQAIHSTFK